MLSMPLIPRRRSSTRCTSRSAAGAARLPRALTQTVTYSGSSSRKNSVRCSFEAKAMKMPMTIPIAASVTRIG